MYNESLFIRQTLILCDHTEKIDNVNLLHYNIVELIQLFVALLEWCIRHRRLFSLFLAN